MTYKQLANHILNLPADKQNLDVSVYCHDIQEFFPVADIKLADDSQDVLDLNHPYITLNNH